MSAPPPPPARHDGERGLPPYDPPRALRRIWHFFTGHPEADVYNVIEQPTLECDCGRQWPRIYRKGRFWL